MKRASVIATIAFISASAVLGCSESETSNPSGPSAISNGTILAADEDPKRGEVGVSQSEMGTFSATASFRAEALGNPRCTSSREGPCLVRVCEDTGGPSQGSSIEDLLKARPHAGEITISASRDIKLIPNQFGKYPGAGDTGELFDPGDEVRFTAVGADVPAFDRTLKVPTPITLTAPRAPTNSGDEKYPLARNEDLALSWSGGTVGAVVALIHAPGASKHVTISCSYKADAGTGTVPSAALRKLPSATATGLADLAVVASGADVVQQDGWTISLWIPGKPTGMMVEVKD